MQEGNNVAGGARVGVGAGGGGARGGGAGIRSGTAARVRNFNNCDSIKSRFNNFMIYARRHKIAILFIFITILIAVTLSLSVAVGQIYNEIFDHRNVVNTTISELDNRVDSDFVFTPSFNSITHSINKSIINSEIRLIEQNNTTIEKYLELHYKYLAFKKEFEKIEKKFANYKNALSKNISMLSKIVVGVKDNMTEQISQIKGQQEEYKNRVHYNITSMITKINMNKKLNEINMNATKNFTNSHKNIVASTSNLRKSMSNIQNSHDNLNLNITKLKKYIDDFTTGYKVFFKNCPQNWTLFGFLNPIYICYKD